MDGVVDSKTSILLPILSLLKLTAYYPILSQLTPS
jgi:hypothetical protein